MRTYHLLSMALLLVSMTSYAEEPSSPVDTQPPHSATREWLELQRSGSAASSQPQPISGRVMERVHERYLKSFTQPIPQYFEHVQPTMR